MNGISWIVAWSDDGIVWTEENMKVMESQEAALWFAKEQESRYNYVRSYEIKIGT